MPNSILSIQEVSTGDGFAKAVSTATSLSDLLELVPAPYRPPMQDLVFRVYRAAIKSGHTRSYLAGLEKHEKEDTFPPEIGARISPPALQISKEFSAASECRSLQAAMDQATLQHKKTMLAEAINLKRKEMSFLQTTFSEDSYREEARNIVQTTVAVIAEEAGLPVFAPDGKPAKAAWPSWITEDFNRVQQHHKLFPARAVALAFTQVSQEMSKKMRGLSLKKKADEDIEMMDDTSRTDNVASIVRREIEHLMKENKLRQSGNGGKGKKRTNSSSNPKLQQGRLPNKVGKPGQRGNSQGGKGKGKKQNGRSRR